MHISRSKKIFISKFSIFYRVFAFFALFKNFTQEFLDEGEIVLAIHLSSHDELRHWIESFLSCSDVNIDASCFDNLPQKIDVPKFTHVEDTVLFLYN